MRLSIPLTTSLLAIMVSNAYGQTVEERLALTEGRLASLEQQNSIEDRITVNGFIRFAMERTNDIKDSNGDDLVYRGSVNAENWDSRRLSRAGVQINARISDQAEAVVQLLGRASDDYDVEAQWAYLAYNLNPDLKLRAGRLVLPFYLHSQYLNVGYAYPWVELPTEIYGAIPIDTMEGVDATWTFQTGLINHNLNVFFGSMQVDVGGVLFNINNQHGVNLRSSYNNFTTWISYTSSQVSLDLTDSAPAPLPPSAFDPFSLDDAYAHYTGVGIQYDNGSLLLMAEATELKIAAPGNWFPTQPASYITAGYRFGKLMPHLTWAQLNARGQNRVVGPFAGILFDSYADRQKSWTLGARYDVTSGIAIKAEASRYYDFGSGSLDTQGVFNGPSGSGAPANANPAVFRLAIDAVF
ncbi:MAG: hypothetical protein ACK4SX_12065 [Alcanivoracaceae bacterium]